LGAETGSMDVSLPLLGVWLTAVHSGRACRAASRSWPSRNVHRTAACDRSANLTGVAGLKVRCAMNCRRSTFGGEERKGTRSSHSTRHVRGRLCSVRSPSAPDEGISIDGLLAGHGDRTHGRLVVPA
jgi:hypothetical protein